ncbi:hypothetical protein BDW75DRAFT_13168 [Aspergillus navahoensis]
MDRSTHSQQHRGPTTLASFQLAKFSYTTSSINHRGPLTWNHVFGNGNLSGIFESRATLSPARVSFRVVRNGWEILEELGITDMVKEFEDQLRSSQDSSRRPAFAVVVKLPCLAVKYPQGPGYVRRFQVKFSSDRDFYSALATLSDINCPFSESNVSYVRPMSRSASSLSNLGQVDPVTRSQHFPTTATETSASSIGMTLPYRATTSPSTTAHPSDAVVPSSSSNFTTFGGTSCHISSTTMGSTHRTRFGAIYPRSNGQTPNADADPFKRPSTSIANPAREIDDIPPASPSKETDKCHRPSTSIANPAREIDAIPPASPSKDTDKCHRPSTSTCFNDLDLPPKRVLPFSNRAAKRSRPSPKAAEKAPLKDSGIDTAGVLSSPAKPRKKASAPRTTKGRRSPKKNHTAPTPSTPLEDHPKSLNQRNTTITTTAKTTSIPGTVSEWVHLAMPANLAKYTSEPTAERTANLQAWLCAHLEDPNFLQLCEDVEGIAERFYLGKERRKW